MGKRMLRGWQGPKARRGVGSGRWGGWTEGTQQTKLYYRNIITILSFAVFNITSAYYGNIAQENTTFTNTTLPNNII